MKAKDLIDVLKQDPERTVTVSIDVSTGDSDYTNRVFSTDLTEIIQSNKDEFTICMEGILNF